VIDLSGPDAARRLHSWCEAEDIAPEVVVNNAGIFSYNDIVVTDPVRIEAMVGLHVAAVSMVCRLFGSDMARLGRGGYILNMSSYAAWMPWPGLALYSASKAYIRSFSIALGAELRGSGVSVTAVLPAGVTTGLYGLSPRLQDIGRRLGLLMTPERVARLALRAMFRRRRRCIPGFAMRLLLPLVCILPPCVIRFARRRTLQYQRQGELTPELPPQSSPGRRKPAGRRGFSI
jgi:short-subunit dehydrogenase